MWANANLSRRAAFSIPGKQIATLLVRVPIDPDLKRALGTEAPVFDAYSERKKNLPFRVVGAGEDGMYVLVDVSGLFAGQEGFVYFGGVGAGKKPLQTPSLVDSRPVHATFRRIGAKGIPDSWEKTLYMYRQASRSVRSVNATHFGRIGPAPEAETETERLRRKRLGSHIIVLESYVLCPHSGVYRWGLRCGNSGFVFVDDEMAINRPGEYPYGSWRRSAPCVMKAGVHKVTLWNVNVLYPPISLGWQPPGAKAMVPVPVEHLVSARCEEHPRVERVDRSVHPAFTATVGRSYGFREHSAVFVPAELESTTSNWLTNRMSLAWFADGNPVGSGSVVQAVVEGASRHTVRLDVRDAFGFESSVSRELDCRFAMPKRYAFAADLVDLEALCYADDRIEPYLRLRGELPKELMLDLSWLIESSVEEPIAGSRTATVFKQDVQFSMGTHNVGELSTIDWRAAHHGVPVDSGQIEFVSPPFRNLPARAVGDALYDADGTRLVLVPLREEGEYSQPARIPAFGSGQALSICFVDDMLALPGLPRGGGHAPFHRELVVSMSRERTVAARHVALPRWESMQRAHGPHVKLALLESLIGEEDKGEEKAVVVFSVGLREILKVGDPSGFERRIAAMADIAGSTLGHAVVWVTPPPYLPDSVRIRPYARAVRKVAAARDMPVADLYTAFLGSEGGPDLFFERKGLALSGEGQRLAARMVRRALDTLIEE